MTTYRVPGDRRSERVQVICWPSGQRGYKSATGRGATTALRQATVATTATTATAGQPRYTDAARAVLAAERR